MHKKITVLVAKLVSLVAKMVSKHRTLQDIQGNRKIITLGKPLIYKNLKHFSDSRGY